MNNENKLPTSTGASILAPDIDLAWLTPEMESKIAARFFGGKPPSAPKAVAKPRPNNGIDAQSQDISQQEYQTRWDKLLPVSQVEAQQTFLLLAAGEPITTIPASKRIAIAENIDRYHRINSINRGEHLACFDMLPEDLSPDLCSLDKKLHHFRRVTPRFVASLSGGKAKGSELARFRNGNDPNNFSVQRAVWEFQSRNIDTDSIDFAGAYLESSTSKETSAINDQLGIAEPFQQTVILKLPQDRYLTESPELALPLSYSDQIQRQVDEKFPVTDLYIPTRTHQVASSPFEPLVIVCGAFTAIKINALRWHALGLPSQLPKLPARLLPSVRDSLYHFMRQVEIPGRTVFFAIDEVVMASRAVQAIVYEAALVLFSLGAEVKFVSVPSRRPLEYSLSEARDPDTLFLDLLRRATPLIQAVPQRHHEEFLRCLARVQLPKLTERQILRELPWKASPADIQTALDTHHRTSRLQAIRVKAELTGPSAEEFSALREFLGKVKALATTPSQTLFVEDGDIWVRASAVSALAGKLPTPVGKNRLYAMLHQASTRQTKLVGQVRKSRDGKAHRYLHIPRDIFENLGVDTEAM